jgi:hypothetical protein
LQEQFEAELIALGRGHASADELVEAENETARVRAEGGAKGSTGETADDRAEEERGNR